MDQTSEFGDVEPEDAWHPEDAIEDQVHNLLARAFLLVLLHVSEDDPVSKVLDEIESRVANKLREHDLPSRDNLRGRQLLEDIAVVRSRIGCD